jgi:secernin
MCDTLVAVGAATADGRVIFAKNSDREPNEAQALVFVPRAEHAARETLRCTYEEIPQVRATHAMLLSKPFWMWGCEMGINEHGVTIGNEAVFTKEPYKKKGGLLGMDLMRLALERARTARAALDVITDLMATYGQGGNGGYTHKLFYHNAYIIADPNEAWVLETAGQYWAAVKVRDIYTISNALTIGNEWDLASPGLVTHAIEKRWCTSEADFGFARCYSDFLYTRLSGSAARRTCSMNQLVAEDGDVTVETMIDVLRDHGVEREGASWRPPPADPHGVCMHAGFGPTRASQSVASLIVHLDAALQTCWATATSGPCTGIFKPVWLEAGLPDLGMGLAGTFDRTTLWWRHEQLHRGVLEDYPTRMGIYREARDRLEREFLMQAARLVAASRSAPPKSRRASLADFSAQCFARADAATQRWTDRVLETKPKSSLPFFYRQAWKGFNRKAGMPG